MKILFVIPSLADGGQEKAGMVLTNYLSQFHDVTVVAFEPASATDYNYQSKIKRIEVKRADSTTGKIKVVLQRIKALKKIKKEIQPDISIAFGPTAMLVNSLSRGKDKKISSIRQSLSKLTANTFLNKLLFSISGKLVPVHDGINKELEALYGIKNNLFAYNGYDLQQLAADAQLPVEENYSSFFNGNVIAHLGRFDNQKCNWQLVKAYCIAREKRPGLKLLLVGYIDVSNPANRNIYDFCINYLEAKGCKVCKPTDAVTNLEGYDVLMPGFRKNPHKYLAKANLFAFPSAWEGFPNALVEAMVCGLPVISADCPTGPAEILKDKNESYGILMPVFDFHFNQNDMTVNDIHQQWADKILQLISDKEQMEFYKAQSLKRVKDFSVEKSCKKWLQIIEDTYNGKI